MNTLHLDNYEKEIFKSVENNEWISSQDLEKEKIKLKNTAKQNIEKLLKNKIIYQKKS